MKHKSLGINAFYNILYKVLNVVFPMISMAYVSRILLADGIGRVSAVSNNVSYFLILATLGIPAYGLREIAKNRESIVDKSKIFSELFVINFILTLATCVLFGAVLSSSFFQKEYVLYIIFGFSILLNIFNVDWLFQGLEEYGYIAARSTVVKIISLLLMFVYVKEKNDIYIYAVIQVAATTGNYFLNIIKSKSYVKYSFKNIQIKRHLKPLAYLALCSVSTELYAKMDITMLDIMKDNSIVGYYTSSQKIINIAITTLVAVTAVFMPRLSYLFDKDKCEFNRILNTGFDMMVTVSIPACVGMIVISKPLVILFLGQSFSPASVTVSLLSLMIPLKCIGDIICYQVMMCARQEALLMKAYFLVMLVNLFNNILLIPRFGAEGASVASVISEILAFAFVLHFSKKYFKLEQINLLLIKTVICSIIMAVSIVPINFLTISTYIKLVIQLIVGVITYFTACLITKHEVVMDYAKIMISKLKRN